MSKTNKHDLIVVGDDFRERLQLQIHFQQEKKEKKLKLMLLHTPINNTGHREGVTIEFGQRKKCQKRCGACY